MEQLFIDLFEIGVLEENDSNLVKPGSMIFKLLNMASHRINKDLRMEGVCAQLYFISLSVET